MGASPIPNISTFSVSLKKDPSQLMTQTYTYKKNQKSLLIVLIKLTLSNLMNLKKKASMMMMKLLNLISCLMLPLENSENVVVTSNLSNIHIFPAILLPSRWLWNIKTETSGLTLLKKSSKTLNVTMSGRICLKNQNPTSKPHERSRPNPQHCHLPRRIKCGSVSRAFCRSPDKTTTTCLPSPASLLLFWLHSCFPLTRSSLAVNLMWRVPSSLLPWRRKSILEGQKVVNKKHPFWNWKSLYGLKQAPANWFETLTNWFTSIYLIQSTADPCLYLHKNKNSFIFFHVDDLAVIGDVTSFKKKFLDRFPNSSAHEPDTLLGMDLTYNDSSVKLSQKKLIEKGLEMAGILTCRKVSTPLSVGVQLE